MGLLKDDIKRTYKVSSITLGFLTHPYKTVQEVVASHVPFTICCIPLGIFVLGAFLFLFCSHVLFALIPLTGMWWFLCWWITSFFVSWQILIWYLCLRFVLVARSSH